MSPRNLWFVCFALTLMACTVLPSYQEVLGGASVRLAGADAAFHLRHTEAVLEDFPRILRQDPYPAFPHIERGLNQGGFDLFAATICRLTGLSPAAVLAWSSPLLLLLSSGALYLALQRSTPTLLPPLFLWLTLLYPGPLVTLAALGHGDHHLAEVALAVFTGLALAWLLRPETPWKAAAPASLPLLGFYWTWPGAPVHLALAALVLYVASWRTPCGSDWPKKLGLFAATLGLGVELTRLLAPWAVIWTFSETLYRLGCGALAFWAFLCVPLGRWLQQARSTRLRLALGAAPLLFCLALPQGRALLGRLLAARPEEIAEHTPISWGLLVSWYGPLVLLAPCALLALWRRRSWEAALVPLIYGSGLNLLWLQTLDFAYYTPLVVSLAGATTLAAWWPPKTGAKLAVLGLLALFPLLGPPPVQRPWIHGSEARASFLVTPGLEQAAAWLRDTFGDRSPLSQQAFGVVAPWDLGNTLAQLAKVPVRYSQTTSPELARLLFSEQPESLYQSMKVEGPRPLRYILIPASSLGEKLMGEMRVAGLPMSLMWQPGPVAHWEGMSMTTPAPSPRLRAALLWRLYWESGQGLAHYRLVYESEQQVLHALQIDFSGASMLPISFPVGPKEQRVVDALLARPESPQPTSRGLLMAARVAPEVRIFEAVPGAVVQGSAPAGQSVVASLELQAPTTGRRWTASFRSTVSRTGSFTLRLPYASDGPSAAAAGSVRALGPYQLAVGGRTHSLSISEQQVQAGARVTWR